MATNLTQDTRVAWVAGANGDSPAIASRRAHGIDLNWHKTDVSNFNARIGSHLVTPARPAGKNAEAVFSTEIYGSDTNAVPPAIGALLRACGLYENATVVAGSPDKIRYEYQLLDTGDYLNYDPVDLVLYINELEQRISECIGDAGLNFNGGEIPSIDWNFWGLVPTAHPAPTDEISPDDFEVQSTPVTVQDAGLKIMLNGVDTGLTDAVVPTQRINFGNNRVLRPGANGGFGYHPPQITRRTPTVNLSVEIVDFDDLNLFEAYIYEQMVTVYFKHEPDGGDGHKLDVCYSGYIPTRPILTDNNGRFMWTFTLQLWQPDTVITALIETVIDHTTTGQTALPLSLNWQAI